MPHSRDVRLLAGAVGLSALGDWLALVPLLLKVEAETGTTGLGVAALLGALWSPSVLLAGPAGWIADRVESRRLLIVTALAAAVACLGLAVVDAFAGMLALTVVLGCANALANPAEFALLPAAAGAQRMAAAAGAQRMAAANGLVETSRAVGVVAGPLLGGLLAAGGGTSVALLADAGTFLVLAGGAWLLHARRHPVPAPAGAPPERARAGIEHLLRDDALALVMAAAFVSLLFMTASWTAEVAFTTDVLGAGEIGYGAFLTVWTIGMAGGAVIARRVPGRWLVAGALVAIVVQGLGLALPTAWLVIPLALGAALLGGLGHGVKNVLVRTLIHERVPHRLHGRASAAYNGLRNAAELAALTLGGVLVAGIGPRGTLALAGGLPIIVGMLALLRRAAWPAREPVHAAGVAPAGHAGGPEPAPAASPA